MSCTVTQIDIQNNIRENIKNNFITAKFTKYSDKLVGFIPYDAYNPNRNTLYGKVKNLESQLNRQYNERVVNFRQLTDGVELNIQPSRKLAEAMTSQNYADENIFNSRVEEDNASRDINDILNDLVQPISDNYVSFLKYKQNQLEVIDNQIKKLRADLNNTNINANIDSASINTKITKLNTQKQKVNLQIEQLNNNREDLMYHAIKQDLEDIFNAFENISLTDTVELGKKIDFYDEFVSGSNKIYKGEPLVRQQNENFGEILNTIKDLQDKYKTALLSAARQSIESDMFIEELKEKNPEVLIDDLLKADKDINWLEKNFIGITADRTNNTVIPQVMMSNFKQTYGRNFSNYVDFANRFTEVLDRTKLKDFSFIYDKDENGNNTGFITDIYSNEYFKAQKIYERKVNNWLFNPSEETYNEAIKELLNTNEVIDFTRLSQVKEIYESLYPNEFTHSDSEINAYENNIKSQLGPRYDDVVAQVIDRLGRFEDYKVEENLNANNPYKERNIAANNIWEFNKLVKNRNAFNKIAYNYEGNTYGVFFKNFKDLALLPKSTRSVTKFSDEGYVTIQESTNYYNENFQDIIEDEDKLAYWKIVKEMSEYINTTYNLRNQGRLTYPKIQEDYAERYFDALGDIKKGKLGKGFADIFHTAAHSYKAFFYEQGSEKEDSNTVMPNYFDKSGKEIAALAETYRIQGNTKEQAYIKARTEVLERYTAPTDFNRVMLGVVMEATLHNTRLEAAPMSEAYIQQFKEVNPDRKNAIDKLIHWHEKVILNQSENYRGGTRTEGKTWSNGTLFEKGVNLLAATPVIKNIIDTKSNNLLTDAEKEIFKNLEIAQEQGKPLGDFNFKLNDINYIKKTEKTSDDNSVIKFYEVINDNLIGIDEDKFNSLFQDYIQDKIKNLGLDLNLAGFIQGILKTVIFKGLAFNPISGIFNRIEGKNSSLIMDATGEYWTSGNIDKANQFLAFANFIRLSPERLGTNNIAKKHELDKFQAFLKTLNTVQDRKNELQKNNDKSALNRDVFNLFALAVDNPEFKNQGAIILSLMMDVKIKDNAGVEHTLFQDGELKPYELIDGKLVLKSEFDNEENKANFSNFTSENILKLKIRMEDAVSRSQGNYDIFDIMLAKKSIWGKASTLFMTWFPEHVNQRFGVSGDNNYNIFTGKKRRDGRFIEAYKSNKLNAIGYTIGALGISHAGLGFAGLASAGVLSAFVYQKFLRKIANPESVQRDINYIQELTEFIKSTLVESLNMPGRILNIPAKINNNSFSSTTMSPTEIASMRAMTRELAVMLTALGVKLAMGMLLYNDDDDKESPERMRYNFIQNQLSRVITSLAVYYNPQELITDNSRVAALGVLSDVYKLTSAIWDEKQQEKLGKNFLNITPLPRVLTKGSVPWEDKVNYDDMPNVTGMATPLKWSSDFIKNYDTNDEYSAEREYKKLRDDRRDEIKLELSKTLKQDELQDAVEARMKLEFPRRAKDEKASNMIERIQSGEKGSTKSTKSKKATKKSGK